MRKPKLKDDLPCASRRGQCLLTLLGQGKKEEPAPVLFFYQQRRGKGGGTEGSVHFGCALDRKKDYKEFISTIEGKEEPSLITPRSVGGSRERSPTFCGSRAEKSCFPEGGEGEERGCPLVLWDPGGEKGGKSLSCTLNSDAEKGG